MDSQSQLSDSPPPPPPPKPSTSGLPQPTPPSTEAQSSTSTAASTFARFTGAFGVKFSSASADGGGVLESFTKGIVDSSRSAVKAVSVKARHIVSQNKRRYQEGGFDLDMSYITDNIIAMGFPAGDLSSGLFGFFEGFYRNHMEEVINFFESHHKGKYKVYNLCSERLYDASLFEGKVACFPFDDHNCPPIQLISSFCQSAHSWIKEDSENVVVVHCKAGMGRTGLMICSLLLYLKIFPTADEAIDHFNQKRCVDGKALVLPSQIRYVKYFERILTHFNGENQPGRRCMLRGFRLHKCPYWIRPSITISNHTGVLFSTKNHPKTKDLLPDDFWISAPKKGILVFALPGEPGLTEVIGDFKIQFHDRQGDFYCWFNTTMTENRTTLSGSDLDGFDKRSLPSPGFQVEVVMIDYDGTLPVRAKSDANKGPDDAHRLNGTSSSSGAANPRQSKGSENEDDVFSDSDGEETGVVKSKTAGGSYNSESSPANPAHSSDTREVQTNTITHRTEQLSLGSHGSSEIDASKQSATVEAKIASDPDTNSVNAIKAMAADASVFTFDDEDDYDSD